VPVTHWRLLGYHLGAALCVGGAAVTVIMLGLAQHSGPARCPSETTSRGARCCAKGQVETLGRCSGNPSRCSPGFFRALRPVAGCAVIPRRVLIKGGRLEPGPSDWHGRTVESRSVNVGPFLLDATEVTVERWLGCVEAGACRPIASEEPGLPVTGVSPAEAATFCGFAGGRLPRDDEWLIAAAGSEARRYPWGQTGLVCRRAAFGLVRGPCGHGAVGPDWAGLRPDGATPDGVLDLVGNAAEWTLTPDGRTVARGGSFQSQLAAELESWAGDPGSSPAPHIGFRCAYDEVTMLP
jgi:formylglycine-generating enzyme required for sulfatase activity